MEIIHMNEFQSTTKQSRITFYAKASELSKNQFNIYIFSVYFLFLPPRN
jgi:hypothetical protein